MIDLDAIEARIRDCKTYNFGLWNADKLAHEDAPAMLNELRRLRVIASGNQGAIVNSIIERTRHEATDDEREALIEEARRAKTAVYLATDASVADDLSRIIGGLADALEAAEEAHTPTDNEREALADQDAADWAREYDPQPIYMRRAFLRGFDAAIHHSKGALPPLWRCPSCPVILVGPQIDGARKHTLEHESENP